MKRLRAAIARYGIQGLPRWAFNAFAFRVRDRLRRIRKWHDSREHRWMCDVRSVIHVGANFGGERFLYAEHNLSVLWIEPIESAFAELTQNIKDFPRQHAIQSLLTDRDGDSIQFNISNNSGLSSSIFQIAEHANIWPSVKFTDSVTMTTRTLDRIVAESTTVDWQALVMDVQGAELKVLQGSRRLLTNVKYILAEAADFNSYHGGCKLSELVDFLSPLGFEIQRKSVFARHPVQGCYYNVLFFRRESAKQ